MSYFNSIVQNVVQDIINSSTSNLNAGIIFNGATTTGTSTLGIVGIQVNLFTTQNCIVYVDQSTDNSNWDITDIFYYYYALGGNSWTIQATASYVRVRVKNFGLIATTQFRLQTVLCPIVDAVPRSLDVDGNFKTSIRNIYGDMGRVRVGPVGTLKVGETFRLAGASFIGTTIDANYWVSGSLSGSPLYTQLNGELILDTGTAADVTGSIFVNSSRTARYIAGTPNYYRSVINVPVATCNIGTNIRRWGAYDTENGYYFDLQTSGSTPVFGVNARRATVDTRKTIFNGEIGSIYILDEYVHSYEIWWSNSKAYFYIDDRLLHTLSGSSTTMVSTNALRIGIENINTLSNVASNTISCRTMSINRLGSQLSKANWKYIAGALSATVLKYGPGTFHRVVCNKNTGTSISIYDSLTATNPICIIDPTSRGELNFDIDFYYGLTVVTVGSGIDCTIVFE